ncbi:MAG: sigma 54-interacting transcriptional regulator [Deferrisomatales bacterium]|nr:sigma 54-interacting transcriptional regulator [Deferrisomatales bacterium]
MTARTGGDLRCTVAAGVSGGLAGGPGPQEDRPVSPAENLGTPGHELEQLRHFEGLLSDLCCPATPDPEAAEGEIAGLLQRICVFFEADHCGLFESFPGAPEIQAVTLHHGRGLKRQPLEVLATRHPWAYRLLVEQGDPVAFPRLDALPPEAAVDRASWEQRGVRAALILPLAVGGRATHAIGLWCTRGEREWPSDCVRRFRVLGEILGTRLLHRHQHGALLRSRHELTEAQRLAHLGSWEWDLVGGRLRGSEEFWRIFGIPPQDSGAFREDLLDRVHPDDRQAVERATNESMSRPGLPYSLEHRISRPDGTERVVDARGMVTFDENQRAVRMIGTIQDVTERKRAEEQREEALDELRRLKERLEAENVYLRQEVASASGFSGIVGRSDAIRYVMYRIRQVAGTEATVLLTGETGTGKGIFARALHQASGRRDKPFINVNCAGLPSNLIESELFGREKGAFTGASARQIGRFELADGGTIFLDEIGELPLELQAKLLKAIEDGEFERLGSPHPVRVDVRVIASSNRDLEEETRKGRFRKDLFYRLKVFPITIPPLRQRREDIPLLVAFYVDKFCKKHGKRIDRISADTMEDLQGYAWPGNVRELVNMVERAVIVADAPVLRFPERLDAVASDEGGGPGGLEERQELRDLSRMNREHILKALADTGWRVEGRHGAARLLGVHPSTLRARMRRLAIRRPQIA